ncbi:MAG: hypothetical protein JXA99_06285 [Candidatus Lokiarchaeota archaeon]|nr:hypothetical protein [Candidatus Lokiarchaeota archaeon]
MTERNFTEIIDRISTNEKDLKVNISTLKEKLEKAEDDLDKKDKKLKYYEGPLPKIKSATTLIPKKEDFSNTLTMHKISQDIDNIKLELQKFQTEHINEFTINKSEIGQINERLDNLIDNFEKTIPESNKEMRRIKEELMVKDEQIRITKQDLNRAIISKDHIIQKLEKDLEAKIDKVNDLTNTIDALYTQISEVQCAPNVIKNIIDIMQNKGFVSDKEFEKILEKELV